MRLGRVGERRGEVCAGEEARDTDVAAEEAIRDGPQLHRNAGMVRQRSEERLEHRRTELAGEDRDRQWFRGAPRGDVGTRGVDTSRPISIDTSRAISIDTSRPISIGASAIDPREESRARCVLCGCGAGERGPDLGLERAGHADPVLVLGEALVRRERRERAAGEQVVLVGGEGEPPAECVGEHRLPPLDHVDHRAGLGASVRSHLRLAVVGAHAEWHHADRRECRETVEDAEECVVEHGAVVDPGAADDLTVHLDARVEDRTEPPQARRATTITQQAGPHVGVGGVNAHVQRREALGDDPFEVGFGEAGQGREVAVEERQPIVVVLQRQARAHTRRELMDEAERTVVVARTHTIEDGTVELEPERCACRLVHHQRGLEPAAPQLEVDIGLVGLVLVANHVAHGLAVEREQFVADEHARRVGRRSGRDGNDACSRHEASVRATPTYPPPVTVERVLLAEPRGFCAGVEMAIKALAWMVRSFEPPVYCYHEIVHNRLVVERFQELGVVFVDDVAEVPAGAPLMLSAHGSAPETVAAARERGGYVVNAVCPLVTKVHHEAKVRAQKGYTILYVGHAGHDEAVGTLAVAPEAMRLVEHEHDLADTLAAVGPDAPVAMLAQTTLALSEWQGMLDRTREQFPALWTAARNDLCFATTNRQAALTEIAARADAVVVIGSANSSNTLALAKVASDTGCPVVLRVDGPDELDLAALGTARVVGVTAGASAPEELVEAVIAKLAPAEGVERVRVTDEDEYFPPPRELRELMPALDTLAALLVGADPARARALGGPLGADRERDASAVLAALR